MSKIIIANWKMNPSNLSLAKKISALSIRNIPRGIFLVVCPPSIFFAGTLKSSSRKYSFGLQNIFYEKEGAFTGEISAEMAREMGAGYVICGHSERRKMGETDEIIAKKVAASLKEKMTPILCVGEHERDQNGAYLEFLRNQIKNSLVGVGKQQLKNIIVAYEPIWTIGKSAAEAMNSQILHETSILIRKTLTDIYGKEARGIKIIYGGSVAPENAAEIVSRGEVDGLLVGHQSLKPEAFKKIMEEVSKA